MDGYRLWRVCDLYSSYEIVSPQVTRKHRNFGERYPLLVLRPSLPVAKSPHARDELPNMGTDWVEVLRLPRCRGVSWVKQVTLELFWETFRCESTRVLR